jgi:hypothetical protein
MTVKPNSVSTSLEKENTRWHRAPPFLPPIKQK